MTSSFSETIKGRRILVTGGGGFIGSHLVARLAQLGAAEVVALDSFRYGDPSNLPNTDGRVSIKEHTLGGDSTLQLAEALKGIDYVFHLAAEKHNQSKDTPYQVIRANVDGTLQLLEQAAAAKVRKVVYTSSLYAYGRMHGAPYSEQEVPRPTTVYGITKLAGEYLCEHARQKYGLAYNVLRYLFIYGPRQFAGMGYKSVIVKNFERILNGQPPIVYGDGTQALDYVYVDDAVEATITALTAGCSGEIFNVASGQATAVHRLIETMLEVAGAKLDITFAPADWTAGTNRVGDNRKAKESLNWSPSVPLKQGLQRTFEWMKGSHNLARPD